MGQSTRPPAHRKKRDERGTASDVQDAAEALEMMTGPPAYRVRVKGAQIGAGLLSTVDQLTAPRSSLL
jgi:hypothetical protein